MNILSKVRRFWAITLPTILLVVTFHYAHQLNNLINLVEDFGFKKTITIIFFSFLAIWSLVYLSSVFLVRALKWIWRGTITTQPKKQNIPNTKKLELHTKDSIEYHDVKEQENLFRLDLQEESAGVVNEEGHSENKVL
jgi:hypothetical protein